MSDHTIMIISVMKTFLYSSSVYSCQLFLISSASVKSIPLLSFIDAHRCMKCSLGISNFLEEISSLSHSIVFLNFLALITEEGFLISPCYSLELCIQQSISFLVCFVFCFSSFHSYFALFFFLGMVLIPVFSTMLRTSVHSPSGTLVYQI